MNAERLLAHFDRLGNAPDAIPRLRRFVLDLAVRGKLVEQDQADEPATALLKRIASRKIALKRETGDRRIRDVSDPQKDDYPIPLPATWQVQSFENLFLFIDYRGKTPPKTSDGIPLITAKNVRSGFLNREPREFISDTIYSAWMTRGLPQIGDLFFTTEAPLGNICENDISEPFALAQRVICLHPYGEINTRYLMFAIMSDVSQRLVGENATGLTAKGIKSAKLKLLPIPVPPLAEQRRIARSVDDLFALCEQLDDIRTAREDTRNRLTRVSHARLNASQADGATFRTHACFVVDALPTLTARVEQVKRLRKSILNLAVQGKLVKKDPADEPASQLLKRIAAENLRLANEGKLQEPRSVIKINRQDLSFRSPDDWGWARLIEVSTIRYGCAFKSKHFNSEKRGMPLIRIRDISRTDAEVYFEGDYDPAYIVRAGDYLVGMDGAFNLHRWKGTNGLLNQRVMRINGWRCDINPKFIRIPLQMVLNYVHDGTSLTTVKHLSAKQVNGIELPLPPLAEQHRIVAKVDELMALCDRLEVSLGNIENGHNRLLESLLREAMETSH